MSNKFTSDQQVKLTIGDLYVQLTIANDQIGQLMAQVTELRLYKEAKEASEGAVKAAESETQVFA